MIFYQAMCVIIHKLLAGLVRIMTRPDRIFDAFCQKERLGCAAGCQPCVELAWVSAKPESLKRIVEHDQFIANTVSSKHLRPKGCHGVHLGVVQSHLLNAFAAEDSGWFLIGIYKGTYPFLLTVAARMLCDRRVLPNIGDPEKELELHEVPVTNLLSMEHTRREEKQPFPKCPVRHQYAHLLYQEIMEFLIFHELAHIVRGHVGYLSSLNGTRRIEELNMALQPGGSLVSRAMKAHADMSAAELCFITSLSKHELLQADPDRRIADDDEVNAIRKSLYADKALNAVRTALAIYLLFRAFAPDSPATTRLQESELIKGSHPHPLVRQGLLMGKLYETLLGKEPDLSEAGIGYAAIMVAENAISFAAGRGASTGIPAVYRNNIKQIQDHTRTLLRKIDEVKPLYDKYAWPVKPSM